MSRYTRRLVRCSVVPLLALASVAATDHGTLIDAIKNQDKAAVSALLAQKVDVNAPEADGATALHWAAHRGDADLVALLLHAGARANVTDDLGITPLSLAAVTGNAAVISQLLKAGADPNTRSTTGETALMTSARVGTADAVKALLAHGADVNAKEPTKGQTALMWAAAGGHPDVVQLLLAGGADARARSSTGFTPLLFAARIGNQQIAQKLLEAGVDVNETGPDGLTPLVLATVRSHTDFALFMLDRGAEVNKDTAGYTALHWAVGAWDTLLTGPFGLKSDYSEWSAAGGLKGPAKVAFVRALLARGANPKARVTKNPPSWGQRITPSTTLAGATPFYLAAAAWDVDTMRLLVEAGADPLARANNGTTPLMMAVGHTVVTGRVLWTEPAALAATKLTLELGGDVNAADEDGDTALHAAAYWGADTIVQFLAEHGANLNAKNKFNESPFMIANAQGPRVAGAYPLHPSTKALLGRLGADTSTEGLPQRTVRERQEPRPAAPPKKP